VFATHAEAVSAATLQAEQVFAQHEHGHLLNATRVTSNMLKADKIVVTKHDIEDEEQLRDNIKKKKIGEKRGRKKKETQSQQVYQESENSPRKEETSAEIVKKEIVKKDQLDVDKENETITYTKNGRKIIHSFADNVLE
jgi:hypothetical protein